MEVSEFAKIAHQFVGTRVSVINVGYDYRVDKKMIAMELYTGVNLVEHITVYSDKVIIGRLSFEDTGAYIIGADWLLNADGEYTITEIGIKDEGEYVSFKVRVRPG